MPTAQPFTPMLRAGLLAAIASPTHTLRRHGGSFISTPSMAGRSGTANVTAISKRTVLAMENNGLVSLDDAACPSSATLTEQGRKAAVQLQQATRSKAGAA